MNESTVSVRVLVWPGFPVVGAGLGRLQLEPVELIADAPVNPVDNIREPPSRIGALTVGAVVGPVVAGDGAARALTMPVAYHDATLGVVVRDEKNRQNWRSNRRSVP